MTKKIILFNTIHYDGIGDFSHLMDIYQAFASNPKINEFEFIPVIICEDSKYDQTIKKKLEDLNIKNYFYWSELKDQLHKDKQLQQLLAEALQIFIISWGSLSDQYEKYINPKAVIKLIGEHERHLCSPVKEKKCFDRSMGLGKGCYGIKLKKSMIKLSEIQFNENDNAFFEQLFKYNQSQSLNHFYENNRLIPAYFNRVTDFVNFVLLLAFNDSFSKEKNISLYASGRHMNSLLRLEGELYLEQCSSFPQSKFAFKASVYFSRFFQNSHIKQIEIIDANFPQPLIIACNPAANSAIRIFYGFNISNECYQALYQNCSIAGVSGDNTLEKAIPHTLPFYISSNFNSKRETLEELSHIIRQIELPEKIKNDFLIYFNFEIIKKHLLPLNFSSKLKETIEAAIPIYKDLDLVGMSQYWPMISSVLMEKYNFFDKLENIFFEGLPKQLVVAQKEQSYPSKGGKLIAFFKASTKNLKDDDQADSEASRVSSNTK